MKHFFPFVLVLATLTLVFPQRSTAQWDYLDVAPGFETLNLAVEGDTTATGDPISLNRVYRLQRGGMYVLNGSLVNIKGAPLRIWAADSAGPKPLIIGAVSTTGTQSDVAALEGEGHFKNLYISGIDNIGNPQRYIMRINPSGTRVVWEGVHADASRQSTFRTYGTETKLFFVDCEFRNAVDLKDNGNGRFFDSRGLMADTILFQNCTVYMNRQRMIRTDGAIARNILLDHNTFYQNTFGSTNTGTGLGRQSAPIETGKGVNVRVTNNIFQDLAAEAMRVSAGLNPMDRLAVLNVDSLGSPTIDESSRNWIVRNNAYGWSPGLKTFWAGIDTVMAPVFIGPYADSVFFRERPNFVQTGNFEELIQFSDAPSASTLLNFIQYRYADNFLNTNNPDPRADRNGMGNLTDSMYTFGLESDPFDFDYPTSQVAYTAGDGGFPVGNLNWFPSKKAEWETWITDVEDPQGIVTEYHLAQNFPNPFNPTTQIEYTLPQSMRVTLVIYNAIGQELTRLVNNEDQSPGRYIVTWNGKNSSGQAVSSGVYYYRLLTPNSQITKKMMLVK